MVKKKLPKSSTAWVGCTNVTDDRQTDRQTTDGRPIAYSERERKFTSAKNVVPAVRLSFMSTCRKSWHVQAPQMNGSKLLKASVTDGTCTTHAELLMASTVYPVRSVVNRDQFQTTNHIGTSAFSVARGDKSARRRKYSSLCIARVRNVIILMAHRVGEVCSR